ncbi:MAG TPA: alpha/beta hydrolase [Acidimicrobiales bacterium]|nr:alpha/beta hydrolase [Acidimicrobiales bacterium]
MTITHRSVETNGISLHIAEAGEGPLVVLLHGFPELWYSYRHQLEALADAGYHAVAPDQRGYGRSEAPEEIGRYSLLHLAGDVVGLIAALGEGRCVVVGHDWGSPVASTVGLFRPDLVKGVALLSVPYVPRGDMDMLSGLTARLGPDNYQLFFQEPGVAEAALGADVRATMISTLVGLSVGAFSVSTLGGGESIASSPGASDAALPKWLTEEDVDYFTGEFQRTGFRGGLNWYRNSLANWELMAPWHHAPLLAPSLYVGGDKDPVVNWPGFREFIAVLGETTMPNLTKSVILEGCGHWTQQERPDEVNGLLLEFLAGIAD